MARAAVQAVSNEQGVRVVLLVRRIPERNVRVHRAGNSELWENTRWQLHVQPQQIGHKRILCVHDPRNLYQSTKWTSRFDWRLPAESDGGRFPFCPPSFWWKATVDAVRTVSGKPAWVDVRSNGWSRPNIPGGAGYHWDVTIREQGLVNAVGVEHINVVEFGAPSSEGSPGDIHHVPNDVAGQIDYRGWRCS